MAAVCEEVLDKVRAGMRGLKPPGHYDKVYKEECMFSYQTPEAPGGLYVNLKTFMGYSGDFLDLDHSRSGNTLYLHETWVRVPKPAEDPSDPSAKPTKLAIGTSEGFAVGQPGYTLDKTSALVVLPGREVVPLPCPDLPELVINVVNAIVAHESASVQDTTAAWEEERPVSKYAANLEQLDTGRKISANPADWACDETGVKENLWLNLHTGHIGSGRRNWDGSGGNGSALRHYEATGKKYPLVVKLGTITPSGADVYSYAADEDDMVTDPHLGRHLAHWGINMMQMEKTEKTMAELQIDLNMRHEFDAITEAGAALTPLSGPGHVGLVNLGNSCYMNSVVQVLFSLPEVVERYVGPAPALFTSSEPDPAADLAVQMAKLGSALVHAKTGSIVLSGPPAPAAAGPTAAQVADAMDTSEGAPASGADAAAAGGGGRVVETPTSVRPLSFKSLVGKGHPEFSSARQQDAQEYLGYLLDKLARLEHSQAARLGGGALPATPSIFTFGLEDRVQCATTGAVSYRPSTSTALSLHIPLEAAANAGEVAAYQERQAKRQKLEAEQATAYISAGDPEAPVPAVVTTEEGSAKQDAEAPVLPVVPLSTCLERWAAAEPLEDYYSAAAGGKGPASRTSRFTSFPPYLVVALKRYYVASDWTPKKMEVEVPMPDTLDLEHLRSSGQQPGEVLQPEEPAGGGGGGGGAQAAPAAAAAVPAAAPVPDEMVVATLSSAGFTENAAKRAALATGNNGDAEAAMNWLLMHLEDADINDPLPDPAAAAATPAAPAAAAAGGGGGAAAPNPEHVFMLTSMGFSEEAAAAALTACSGSVERAGDWLFSHMDDLDAAVAAVKQQAAGGGGGGGGAAAGGGAAGGAAAGSSSAPKLLDGPGRYKLLAIISHMGSSTACGHYVAHIRKEGRWVIFNDEKVAASEHPPLGLGYMYVYQRTA